MLKVLKYLKKSAISVSIIIILLCIQAAVDLALPDYTSRIVNIGIQQGGIQNVAPEVIRKTQMENLLLFTKDNNEILENYTLLTKQELSQQEYERYIKKYPELKNQELYKLKKLTKQELEKLDNIIARPLIQLSILDNEHQQEQIKQKIIQELPEEQKTLIERMTLIEIIKQMPEEQLDKMLEQTNEQLDEMMGTILEQAAIAQTKKEYEQIGMDLDKLQNNYILLAAIQMLTIALISMIAAVSIMFLSSKVAARLGRTLRDKVFEKVLKFSTKEFREFSTASLITRNTNDIQQIQMLITMLFRVVVYAPIIGIGGFIRVLTNSDSSMAWIIGLAIICIVGVVLILFIIAMPKFKKLQELIDKLNLVAREILTGLPVIRAFNKERKEEERFDIANKDLMQTNIFVNRAMSIMMPALMFIMNSIMLLIVWVGGHGVEQGIIQVGDMMAFIQYTMQIVMAFLMISMISIMLPRAAVSAKRINEVLDSKMSIKDEKNPKSFDERKKGLVEFKEVSFRYPDADTEILTDINFVAKPGETTAIIGSTGSGKSTIINLIPRFYDVTGGELLIDGVNIKQVSQKELRDKIGFVPQKGILFSGTIESNIKYGNPNMSDEQMEEAAKIAQATEFIQAKPEKYKTPIAQGGSNVSGGQRQRLSIARAIAINPEIFIFDDSFSALDLKTDAELRAALLEKTKDKTVIIVAQRISTILNADQIIVLEEGKIVGKGKHEELMKNCETYAQIALSQLSKEELE
ncbi:MAG: ATP-binding cassette domain-containing protein [Clostridia bacterium]|jgi:ATP-binding cassette subfamily B multidrug efflux pump|nr:ATP-binding cassette domain-containing protein [Clostridia bacterium]